MILLNKISAVFLLITVVLFSLILTPHSICSQNAKSMSCCNTSISQGASQGSQLARTCCCKIARPSGTELPPVVLNTHSNSGLEKIQKSHPGTVVCLLEDLIAPASQFTFNLSNHSSSSHASIKIYDLIQSYLI